MNGKMAIMLLGMLAKSKTEEELITEVIANLQEYKTKGCPAEDRPSIDIHMLMLKWTDRGLEEIASDADRMTDIHDILTKEKKFNAESDKGV